MDINYVWISLNDKIIQKHNREEKRKYIKILNFQRKIQCNDISEYWCTKTKILEKWIYGYTINKKKIKEENWEFSNINLSRLCK